MHTCNKTIKSLCLFPLSLTNLKFHKKQTGIDSSFHRTNITGIRRHILTANRSDCNHYKRIYRSIKWWQRKMEKEQVDESILWMYRWKLNIAIVFKNNTCYSFEIVLKKNIKDTSITWKTKNKHLKPEHC